MHIIKKDIKFNVRFPHSFFSCLSFKLTAQKWHGLECQIPVSNKDPKSSVKWFPNKHPIFIILSSNSVNRGSSNHVHSCAYIYIYIYAHLNLMTNSLENMPKTYYPVKTTGLARNKILFYMYVLPYFVQHIHASKLVWKNDETAQAWKCS